MAVLAAQLHIQPSEMNAMTVTEFLAWIDRAAWYADARSASSG